MGTLTFIRVTSASLDLMDRVAEDVFDNRIDARRLAACVASPMQLLLVALSDGIVIGQTLCAIHHHPDRSTELYIDDLGVAPAWQRQGIATRLVRLAMAEGRAAGCEEIWVGAEPDNPEANAFYASLGMTVRSANIFEGVV